MERDTILSHGISNFVKESMMERSDKFCWCICKRCGTLVSHNIKENINTCKNCNNDDVAVIQTPYAFKLFIQELETMGIQPRLNTELIDMPIDQMELVRGNYARGRDDGSDDDGVDDDGAGGAGGDDSSDSGNSSDSDVDYQLFNSQVDNFATKNTIVDVKQWADTYDKNKNMKGGGDTNMGFYEVDDEEGSETGSVKAERKEEKEEESEEDEEDNVSEEEEDNVSDDEEDNVSEEESEVEDGDSGGSIASSIGGDLEEELFEDDANAISDASVSANYLENTIEDATEDVSSKETKSDDIKYVDIVE
jgi:hypothetical protein